MTGDQNNPDLQKKKSKKSSRPNNLKQIIEHMLSAQEPSTELKNEIERKMRMSLCIKTTLYLIFN